MAIDFDKWESKIKESQTKVVPSQEPIDFAKFESKIRGQTGQPSVLRHAVGVIPRGLATGVTEAVKGIGRLEEMAPLARVVPFIAPGFTPLFRAFSPEKIVGGLVVKAGGFATKQVERALPLRDIKDPYARFFGTTLPIGAGRLGGVIVASAITGGLGAPAWIGGAVLGGFSQASEEYDKALKATGDPNKATQAYFPNLLIGAVDAVPVGLMFNRLNRLSGGAGNKIVAKWATGRVAGVIDRTGKRAPRLTGGGLGAIEEMVTEVGQEMLTNMTAQQVYDESRTLLEGTTEAGAAGAILGFFANAIGVHARLRAGQPDISTEEQQLYQDASDNIEQAKVNIAEQMADRARPPDISDEQWATLRPKFVQELTERIETGRWLELETTTGNAQDVAGRLVMQQVMDGTLKSENPDVQQVYDDIRTGTRRGVPSAVSPVADEVESHLRNQHINEIELGVYAPVGESREIIATGKRVVKHVESTARKAELEEQLATLEQAPETPVVEQEVVDEDVPTQEADEGTQQISNIIASEIPEVQSYIREYGFPATVENIGHAQATTQRDGEITLGMSFNKELLRHELYHSADFSNRVPDAVKDSIVNNSINHGKAIAEYMDSNSDNPQIAKELAETRDRIGVVPNIGGLMNEVLDMKTPIYGEIAKRLGLLDVPATSAHSNYVALSAFKYWMSAKMPTTSLSDLDMELIADKVAIDDDVAAKVFKLPGEIPATDEAVKGEVGEINKQLSVLSKSILSEQQLRSNTKKLITDIDKKVKQELEAQGLTPSKPTEIKPPGKRTQQAVARELKQAQEDILAALGRNKDGTIKARQRHLKDGRIVSVKGNYITITGKNLPDRTIRLNQQQASDAVALFNGYQTMEPEIQRSLLDMYAQFHDDINPSDVEAITNFAEVYGRIDQTALQLRVSEMADDIHNKLPTIETRAGLLGKMATLLRGTRKPNKIDIMELPSHLMENPVRDKRKLVGFWERVAVGQDTVLRRMGDAGNIIANQLGDVIIEGQRLSSFYKSRVSKILQGLNKRERLHIVDYLELTNLMGQASPKIVNAANSIKSILDEIRARAIKSDGANLDVELIEHYFPHVYEWDNIYREDKIENIIRQIAVAEGITEVEADRRMREYIRVNRERVSFNLEKERLINMDGYIREPEVALYRYLDGAVRRIVEAEVFGAKDENLNSLIQQVENEGFDSQTAQEITDSILGKTKQTHSKVLQDLSKLRNIAVVIRMGWSAVPNLSQSLFTAYRTNAIDTTKAIFSILASPKARIELAEVAGALPTTGKGEPSGLLGTLFSKSVEDFWNIHYGIGQDTKTATYLKIVGFTPTERFNRIVAANAGIMYGNRMLNGLLKKSDSAFFKQRLSELVDSTNDVLVDELLTEAQKSNKKKVTFDDLGEIGEKAQSRAALRVAEDTQFGITGGLKLPHYWSHPIGKLMSQFKTFSFRSVKLLKEQWKSNPKRLAGNMLVLAPSAWLSGALITMFQSVLSGREPPEGAFELLLEPFAAVGTFGMYYDLATAATSRWRTITESLAPPILGIAARPIEAIGEALSGEGSPERAAEVIIGLMPFFGRPIAGQIRRMRREKPAVTTRRRPAR